MEELVSVMEEIRDLLSEINYKLDKLDDIENAIQEISSNGVYGINDVCSAMGNIETSLTTIESSLSNIEFNTM